MAQTSGQQTKQYRTGMYYLSETHFIITSVTVTFLSIVIELIVGLYKI